jgi:hypothetical protein
MVRATRKRLSKRNRISKTVPEIKRTFDLLERELPSILKMKSSTERVKRFQAVWKGLFGRPVNTKAAEAYLQVKASSHKKGTRRSQRGGFALKGAPIDSSTGPGAYGVYGSYPEYVNKGLGFYNTINKDSLAQSCGTQDITPQVPVSIGDNRVSVKGGGVLTSASDALFGTFTRPFGSSNPTSPQFDLQTSMQGRPLPQSGVASDTQLRLMPSRPY